MTLSDWLFALGVFLFFFPVWAGLFLMYSPWFERVQPHWQRINACVYGVALGLILTALTINTVAQG